MILIFPCLNTHSDRLKKVFLKPKLSLEKIRVRLELVLVFIHRYQLTYYTKVIYEKNCVGSRMFVVVM